MTGQLTIIRLAKSLYSAPEIVPTVLPSPLPTCCIRLGGGSELTEALLACPFVQTWNQTPHRHFHERDCPLLH